MTEVFKHLGLEENDYFGLQYQDSKDQVVRQAKHLVASPTSNRFLDQAFIVKERV